MSSRINNNNKNRRRNHKKKLTPYEPSAAELKQVWKQREITGMDDSLDKMNQLLNKFTAEDEDLLSSPEVSPVRNNNNKTKEFRDWSAASVFDDDNNSQTQKSPPLLQSTQSPFQPYVPKNNQNSKTIPSFINSSSTSVKQNKKNNNNKYKIPEIPKFDRKPSAVSSSKSKNRNNNNNLDQFSPKQLQRTMNKRIGKDIPEQVIRRAIKDILHRNSRDVTVRSLRLQLQIALGADFTGCDKLISKLVDEINGVRNGTDDNFLKELQALKKARDAKQAKQATLKKTKIQNEKKQEEQKTIEEEEKIPSTPPKIEQKISSSLPININKKKKKTMKTSMPDFEMRRKLGLLTNSEKQKLKECSAIMMQSLARMFLAKIELQKRKELKLLNIRANKLRKNNAAAIKIQSHARARLQRKKYFQDQEKRRRKILLEQQQKKASLILQKHSRGFIQRKRFKMNQNMKINAITMFQKIARGYKARKQYNNIKQERFKAVEKIQAHARKRIQQQQFQKTKKSAIIIESKIRAAKQYQQFKNMKQSTKTIQTSFRKYLSRKQRKEEEERNKQQEALFLLQQEEEKKRQKLAAIQIQKNLRGMKRKKQYNLEKKSIVTLQKNVRGHLNRKQHKKRVEKKKKMEKVINDINNNAAVVLQKRTRGFLQRQKQSKKETNVTISNKSPPGLMKVNTQTDDVDNINQIKEAGRGIDLPKVRTAGFAHVKRFRDSSKLPELPVSSNASSNIPVRVPTISAGSNSVSLPNLRSNNGVVNPNWGRGNVRRVGGGTVGSKSNRIRSLNSRKKIQTKAQLRTNKGNGIGEKGQQPKWGNNFGIRNQYGLYKS